MARPLHRSLSLSWTAQPGHSNSRLSIARRALTAVPITDAPNVTGPCLNRTIRSETAEPDKAIPGPALTRPSFPGLPNEAAPYLNDPDLNFPRLTCQINPRTDKPDHAGPDPDCHALLCLSNPCQSAPLLSETAGPTPAITGQIKTYLVSGFFILEPYATRGIVVSCRAGAIIDTLCHSKTALRRLVSTRSAEPEQSETALPERTSSSTART